MEKRFVTPLARSLAEKLGINIDLVKGTGPGGRVMREDVIAFSKNPQPTPAAPAPAASVAPIQQTPATPNPVAASSTSEALSGKVEKVAPIRKAIARAMKNSWSSVAYVNLVNEIDVTNLWYLRKKVVEDIQKTTGLKITFLSFISKAILIALQEFPILASYAVIKEAVEWARGGNGPVLVEFLTWRQGVHTSSDNPRIYRTEEEEKEHEKWEPFHRIEKYLKDKKYITDEEIKQIWDSSLDKVKTTYEESLKELDTQLDEIFDHTYATLTQELKEQKQHAKDYYAKEGK